jgi:phage terminase large subunit-like protein
VREGWVTQTQGNTTDFSFIEADIIKNAELFDVQEVAFDRFMAGEIINNLTNEGLELTDFGMGFVSMGPPTSELERLLSCKGIAHNGNPVLDWMSANVVTRKDPAGNIKPDKEASSEKIDGIVAIIMALGRTMATREQAKKSPYERRGLRTLSAP